MNGLRTYLDYNATAPMRPGARAAMMAAMEACGNASSVHREGRAARRLVEDARAQVARLADVPPGEVVFTGSGTEAVNGVVLRQPWDVIVASGLEHDAVIGAAKASGAEVIWVDVTPGGQIDLGHLEAVLAEPSLAGKRILLALQAANNETGVVQPVREAARLAHAVGAQVFCDAVQAAGKIDISRSLMGADYLAISAHKLGGPQGVGALIMAAQNGFKPLAVGGGQESYRRAGTENVAGIAAFGAAADEAVEGLVAFGGLASLRDDLEAGLCALTPGAQVLGGESPRLSNTSAIALPGRRAETMVIALDLAGIAVSSGSACSSGKVSRSRVLEAMGLDDELVAGAVRISMGYATTRADVERFLDGWDRFRDKRGEVQLQTQNVA